MKIKSYLFFIFFFSILSVTQSQNKKNKSKTLKDIDYYRSTNLHTDSIIKIAKEMQQSSIICEKVKGRSIEANMYYRKGDYKKSEAISLETLSLIKDPKNDCERNAKFNVLGRLFWIKKNTGKYKEALDYTILKENLSTNIADKNFTYHLQSLSNSSNKALIKRILGFNNEAIQTLKKAIRDFNKENYKQLTRKEKYALTYQKSSAYNILGESYLNKSIAIVDQDLDSAFFYFKKAFNEAKKFDPPHKNTKPFYELNRVKVLIKKKCFLKALELLNSFTNEEKKLTKQSYTFYKSVINHHQKNNDSALLLSKRYLTFSKATPSRQKNRIVIYDILAKEYKNIKQHDSAYKYSQLVLSEISKVDSSKIKASKSNYLYDFNKIKNVNKIAINNAKKKHYYLIVVFIITILLSIFIIYRQYIKRKKNKSYQKETISQVAVKKEYNIDKKLEKNIMKQLKELEEKKLFLDKDLNIIDLAKKMETNASYLSYILNKNKNISFKQYLLELRINYLTERLKTDRKLKKYTIQSLAEEIGYTNASAFTRAFKKHVGVTPSNYIKSLKN
jgi:AraC-like DNA-binding protein